jgi:hypothetical protein
MMHQMANSNKPSHCCRKACRTLGPPDAFLALARNVFPNFRRGIQWHWPWGCNINEAPWSTLPQRFNGINACEVFYAAVELVLNLRSPQLLIFCIVLIVWVVTRGTPGSLLTETAAPARISSADCALTSRLAVACSDWFSFQLVPRDQALCSIQSWEMLHLTLFAWAWANEILSTESQMGVSSL